jgi:hypothetical protein
MLGYTGEYIGFGNDIFDESKEGFAFNYYNGVFQLTNDSLLLQFDERKTTGLFKYKEDVFLKNNLIGKYPEAQAKMERKIKAILQQYNNRMLDNRLLVK